MATVFTKSKRVLKCKRGDPLGPPLEMLENQDAGAFGSVTITAVTMYFIP